MEGLYLGYSTGLTFAPKYNRPSKEGVAKEALNWLEKNDPKRKIKKSRAPKRQGLRGKYPREVRAGKKLCTIREFCVLSRNHCGTDCLFVPGAMDGRPSRVDFCGKSISAARYMALLTYGTPKSEGMVVRHLCGNGHLSCVNPAHLAWGSPGDNISDANKHRALGSDATEHDKINAVTPST